MFKVCISLIFLLYIINSRINFTEAQTLVKQRQSPDYYALAVENNQNRCLVSNIVIFNHTQRLNLFDITPVTPSSLEISAVSTANISQQIFLLNGSYNVQYTTLEFKVNNLPYHASNSYHCFDQANIDGFNLLLKATSYYNPPDFSLIFPFSIQIPLYVSPYQMTVPLNCSSPPYECQVFPLGTASNEYYAQLKKLPYGTYVYNETIPVTISNFWNSNQNFVIDVDNKFPVETASDPPSNIKIFRQYPDSNTIVKMDSLLQPKRIVILFTTTEPYHKTLVYEQIIFGTNLAPSTWNLVKSNGSETTYLITSPLYSSSNWNNYSIYTIVDNTIKQLYKFTNITYEIPSFSPQLSSAVNYVGGVSVQQTLSSMLPWYVNGVVKLPVTELTFEFPFGYINFNPGTNDYYWDISIYYPINSKGDALSKYCMSSDACLDTTETFTPLPAYDQTNFSSIEINSMTVKPLNSYSYLVAINITSYFRIIQLDYCGWIIRSSDLVSGSANNGVYEKLIQLSLDQTFSLAPYLKVYDETSIGKEMITFKEFQINSKGDTIPLLPSSIYPFIQFTSVNSFRSFKFQFNNIDISGGYFTNMLEIVFNVVDNPSFIPILVIGDKDLIDRDYQTKNLQFYGVYNPNTKSHQIRFEIPPQFTSGDMIYYLVTPYRVFNNSILSGFLGESATLKISKSQGDMLVPRLFYINSITANKVPIVTNATIGWELTIDENPNGFKNGIVTVLSTYDLEPRIFLINESNLVSGDKYAGIYRFNITISIAECRDKMQLYISNMELFDDGDVLLNPNIYPPLSFVYNTNPIELSCASKPYTQSPFIKSLEITPSVDVGSPSRYVQINMTVQDGSGGYQISPRHNPYVYLISYPDSVKIPLEAAEGNATNVRYTANFKLPYGMGNGDHFYLSVYGIMDRYYQINGYPTDMLRTTSLPYSINRTFTLNQDPTLQSYSPFVSDIDTVISVYGFSLGSPGTTLSAEINYGTRYQSLVINTRSETLISINVTSFRALGIQSAKIRVLLRGNIYSNEIVLIPQKYIGPTPTTTPTQTPSLPTTCNPKCSDHGVCQNQQCICSGRWVGPTCSSEIIPISPPLPEPKPSTNVQVENKINITVGIIQINELDTDLSIVNSFDLRNITWSFKDLSTTKDIIYFYSTKLPGREETTINTTLQFFKDETFIKFGSKNITMLPSSIKFTSSLSKFNFGTKQNLLDVIFEASILSNDQGSCSSQLSGNITDGQYIKININEYSLYGSFIDTIILDGRETLANNIIQNDKSSHQSSFIQVAVRIPQYEETVIIDPNFSALVDIEDEGTSKLCKPKKKLSNGAIAGIVVGCIVFISIIIIPIIIYKRKVYYEFSYGSAPNLILVQEPSYYAFTYDHELQRYRCFSTYMIRIMNPDVKYNITDFISYDPYQNLKVNMISTLGPNQIFQLNATLDINNDTLHFKVRNNNISFVVSTCLDPSYVQEFTLVNSFKGYFDPSTLLMTVPFIIGTNPIRTAMPLVCEVPYHSCRVNQVGTIFNEYFVQISRNNSNHLYKFGEQLDISIKNMINQSQSIIIKSISLFPQSYDGQVNLPISQYPSSNSSVEMDQLFRINNMLVMLSLNQPIPPSLIYISPGQDNFPNFKLMKSNGITLTYLMISDLSNSKGANSNEFNLLLSTDFSNQLLLVSQNISYLRSELTGLSGGNITDKEFTINIELNGVVDGRFDLPLLNLPFGYPFGYVSNINNKYQLLFTYYISQYSQDWFTFSYSTDDVTINNLSTTLSLNRKTNNSNIELNSLKMIPINSFSFIIQVNITSYYNIVKMDYCGTIIKSSDLASGTTSYGVYQKLIRLTLDQQFLYSPYLSVYDETSLDKEFVTFLTGNYFINSKGDLFPKLIPLIYPIIELKMLLNIDFGQNNIDISRGYFLNEMTIWIKGKENPNFTPILVIGDKDLIDRDYQTKNLQFYGVYNSSSKSYHIRFEIPPQFPSGDMIYYLVTPYRVFNNSVLSGLIGETATLKISKSKGDMMVPIIKEISAFPSTNTNNLHNSLGWYINIEDRPNGFKYGNLTVKSTYDLEPRILIFNETNRVSGNNETGIYFVTFHISSSFQCINQTFYISNIELFDGGDVLLNPNIFSSLSTIIGKSLQFKIKKYCENSLITYETSNITQFSITPTVDVGKRSRQITINMTVENKAGLSDRHNPYVYLTSVPDSIQIPTKLISGNGTVNYYSAEFQLPYGLGNEQSFYISVYGIMDSTYTINGYTSLRMKSDLNLFYLNRTFSLDSDPTLESHSPFKIDGGYIAIHGYSLGSTLDLLAEINYGSGYIPITLNDRYSIMVSINIASFRDLGINSAKFRVFLNNSIYSNEIDLIPLKDYFPPVPTLTPIKPSTCNPKCSDHGVCQNQQCICSGRWVGPTCSSEIIPISPPLPEPKPSTNVQVENKINITVGIIQINELDTDLSIVNSFDLRNITWSFKDLSTTKDIIYFYSTKLPGRDETTINTTLQFFKDETFIKFGSKNITMLPSSIKFTSSLSKFNFGAKQNLLDVIFEASILSNDQSSCSSQLSGNITDGQYIKININEYSLYGSFIDTIILDGRETLANNIIQNDKSSHQSSFIQVAVRIPQYEETVIIDPNFSALVDIEDEGTSKLCKPKKKLSNGAIAGIVVGCVVFISLIIIPIIIYKRTVYYGVREKIISLKRTKK